VTRQTVVARYEDLSREPRPRDELDLVEAERRRPLGDERRDDGRPVGLPAKEAHRLGAQMLVAPLADGVERREE
jgi:hypothetical protein